MGRYTDWEFTMYVVTPVISLLANSNNSLGVRISSEKGLCKLTWAANLFKVSPAPSQGEKPETLCRYFYPDEQSSLGSPYLELTVTSRHIFKADIINRCTLQNIKIIIEELTVKGATKL